jgi:limonene-1,2-epoxide hydrolase
VTPREQQAAEFFAAWGRSFDGMCTAFEALLAEDCVWDQRPIPRLRGPAQAVRFVRIARRTLGMETIEVELLRVAAVGDAVHTERIDHLLRADGSLIVSAPVAGVLVFEGDRVTYWREYFDAGSFTARTLASSAAYAVRRALRPARRGAGLAAR